MKKRSKRLLILGGCAGVHLATANAAEISITVAQTGADSGIRNRLFTTWLPAGLSFAGVRGRISLIGNAPGFSEALVLLGTTPDNREACARRNATLTPTVPAVSRLWAGILKSNDISPVRTPVSVALPNAIPPATPAGTCLATIVSAGYPYLRRNVALYTTTTVQLTVATSSVAADPVQAFGMGGEFKFAPGTANYVGIQANRPLAVDAIAASVSAAPVAGAPDAARWGVPADGHWQVATEFLLLPAPACNAAHFASHQAGPDYRVLRLAKPAPMPYPAGATLLLSAPLTSRAMQAVQATAFSNLAAHRSPAHLRAGDCLVAFTSVPKESAAEALNVENQSTAYLRPQAHDLP